MVNEEIDEIHFLLDLVLEQKRDFERITVYEIALNDTRRDYQQDLSQNEHVKYEKIIFIISILLINLG
jgi:hypothetical protein